MQTDLLARGDILVSVLHTFSLKCKQKKISKKRGSIKMKCMTVCRFKYNFNQTFESAFTVLSHGESVTFIIDLDLLCVSMHMMYDSHSGHS